MVTVGEGIYALYNDHLEELPDSIFTCDIHGGYYMLSLFLVVLFVLFLLLLLLLFLGVFFSKNRNMI